MNISTRLLVVFIAAVSLLLLGFLFVYSVDVRYVVGLDTEKAVLTTPRRTYRLHPGKPVGTSIPFSKPLILCAEAPSPPDPRLCFNGAGIAKRGYLDLASVGKQVAAETPALEPGKTVYQLDGDRNGKSASNRMRRYRTTAGTPISRCRGCWRSTTAPIGPAAGGSCTRR